MARRKSMADDDGWGSSSRSGDDIDLDITPMIDVTFLLLIFFMVTSTMKGTPDLDVPPAKHGKGVETGAVTMIDIKKGDPPIIQMKGTDLTLDDVRTKVEQGLQEGKTEVIIMADREVPHGFTMEVAKAVNEFEGITFSFGVTDKRN